MSASVRTRLWLLASTARPTTLPFASRGLMANVEYGRRSYAAAPKKGDPSLRSTMKYAMQGNKYGQSTSIQQAEEMEKKMALMKRSTFAILAPRTFVAVTSLSKIPPDFWDKLRYYTAILKQRAIDRFQIELYSWRFRPKWYKRSTFRPEPKKKVVAAALELHTIMSESLARGDEAAKAQLQRICVPKLARSLTEVIESRPKGKRYRWERLSLTGWPLWPRVVDYKWMEVNIGLQLTFRQAVVGIRSKQRLTELDSKGRKTGTVKELDLTEYLVLWQNVDHEKQSADKWLLYGTLKETSFAEVMKENSLTQELSRLSAEQQLRERQYRLSRNSSK